jgi:hypothetical protein
LGPDFYLLKKAITQMKSKDVKRWFSMPILCPESTLEKKFFKKFHAKQFINDSSAREIKKN